MIYVPTLTLGIFRLYKGFLRTKPTLNGIVVDAAEIGAGAAVVGTAFAEVKAQAAKLLGLRRKG